MPKLTPKQSRFVEEYLIDPNGTQAVILAGFSERSAASTAVRLLRNPKIQKAIAEGREKIGEQTHIDQAYVLNRLAEIVERCMQHEPVRDRSGEPTGEYRFDSRGAVKALELLGKHNGMFMNRVKLSLEGEAAETLAKLMGIKPEDLPE